MIRICSSGNVVHLLEHRPGHRQAQQHAATTFTPSQGLYSNILHALSDSRRTTLSFSSHGHDTVSTNDREPLRASKRPPCCVRKRIRRHHDLRRRRPVAKRGMRPHPVVVPTPTLNHNLCLPQRVEHLTIEQLVTQPRIETLDIAVLPRTARRHVGRLGAERSDPPLTASAMNSGPLSERIYPGTPRSMNNSASISMTSTDLSLRATRMARHSRVNSSTRLSMRCLRPSWVRSSTKS